MTTTEAASSAEPPLLPARARRPVLVWVIFIFYLFVAFSSVVQVVQHVRAERRLDAHGQTYTVFDYVESLALVGLKVTAAVMLFRLSRMGFTLFLAILALNVVVTGYDLLAKGLPPPAGPVMIASIALGFVIMTLICVYAWRLQTKGVLK